MEMNITEFWTNWLNMESELDQEHELLRLPIWDKEGLFAANLSPAMLRGYLEDMAEVIRNQEAEMLRKKENDKEEYQIICSLMERVVGIYHDINLDETEKHILLVEALDVDNLDFKRQVTQEKKERAIEIIRYRFGIGRQRLTLKETGLVFGISASSVQQIESKVLRLMRRYLGRRGFFKRIKDQEATE